MTDSDDDAPPTNKAPRAAAEHGSSALPFRGEGAPPAPGEYVDLLDTGTQIARSNDGPALPFGSRTPPQPAPPPAAPAPPAPSPPAPSPPAPSPPAPAPPAPAAHAAPSPGWVAPRWQAEERPAARWAPQASRPISVTEDRQRDLERAARAGVEAASFEAARAEHGDRATGKSAEPKATTTQPWFDLLWFDAGAVAAFEAETLLRDDTDDSGWLVEAPSESANGRRERVAEHIHQAPVVPLGSIATLQRERHARRLGGSPIVCLEGELELHPDPSERLRRMADVASIHAEPETRLQKAIDRVAAALEKDIASPEILDALERELRDAFGASARGLDARYLETSSAPALLRSRAYVTRTVFGGAHVRATLDDGSDKAVVYLPEAARDQLPLLRAFAVRLFASVRSRQEAGEGGPLVLVVRAIAQRSASQRGDAHRSEPLRRR